MITRDQLATLLDRLVEKNKVIAPVSDNRGVVRYTAIRTAGDVAWEFDRAKVPPKSHFLPQTEELYCYDTTGGELRIEPVPAAGRAVVFGVHPCDLRAIAALDPVFDGVFKDVYYLDKRERTVVVGLACKQVLPGCFCRSYGIEPTDGEGADLMLTEVGDRYYAEILTPKGEALVREFPELFSDGGVEEGRRGKEALSRELAGQFQREVDLTGVKEKVDTMFEHPYWQEVARKCIGCGICTYLCPTCHCFDIIENHSGHRGSRLRCWDSCMFTDFTLHTSSHNPRSTKKERVRNRFLHKLSYHNERYGLAGCVGCGRCVAECPVNIDITKIIADIKEVD
ncbi:MAG: sulfite reductase [Desulforudis sp.]|jgi:ferredoxin|nr:MAG: sulfite reductase [Desulforudis sp.]